MSDSWFIILFVIIGAGLPLYIYLVARSLIYGYVWHLGNVKKNVPHKNRNKIVESPIDWHFFRLTMKYGHPDWSRAEMMIPWVIARALLGAIIGLVLALILILFT